MKFCRNLQRVIDITDPEWAPYWTNYKMLKKFLKALVPPDAAESATASSLNPSDHSGDEGDANGRRRDGKGPSMPAAAPPAGVFSSPARMSRSPGEVAFFRLLNSELRKAIHFFDQAQAEFAIREARVREGIGIMRKAESLMVSERWTLMAKSLYRLYKDLLLLETFAIMTYCSFSKILKKHDKVTKHNTRIAFMKNVVNKANFTHYPKLMGMISRCEQLYDEVSQSLTVEGKSGLHEDERLFINMIHRLNEQVLDTAEGEGAPSMEVRKEKLRPSLPPDDASRSSSSSCPSPTCSQVDTLRSLVEENAMNKSSKEGLAWVAESEQVNAAMANNEKMPARHDAKGLSLAEPTNASPESEGRSKRLLTSRDSEGMVQPVAKRADRSNDRSFWK